MEARTTKTQQHGELQSAPSRYPGLENRHEKAVSTCQSQRHPDRSRRNVSDWPNFINYGGRRRTRRTASFCILMAESRKRRGPRQSGFCMTQTRAASRSPRTRRPAPARPRRVRTATAERNARNSLYRRAFVQDMEILTETRATAFSCRSRPDDRPARNGPLRPAPLWNDHQHFGFELISVS